MSNTFVPGSLLQPREMPDPHQLVIDALEAARKSICGYGPLARTCDCKYGLIPYAMQGSLTAACRHSHCEHTGCPEIRELLGRFRAAQREAWARKSDTHVRTTHGWLCCLHHPGLNFDDPSPAMYDGTPAGAACGGAGYCHTCTPEADRAHGLLPPLEVAGDASSA